MEDLLGDRRTTDLSNLFFSGSFVVFLLLVVPAFRNLRPFFCFVFALTNFGSVDKSH